MAFGRVLTAMVTPMHADGSVNFEAAEQLARHLAATGSDGIVVSGTTGESPTLTFEEKVKLFQVVRAGVDSRVMVIAGTGSYSTNDTIHLTREADRVGVDGIMLVVPYYNKPTQDGMYHHFAAVAAETSLPIMLYNVPGRTSQNLLPQTVARIADGAPNVVAIKEASGNLEQVTEVRRLAPASLAIYSGDDALTLPILAVGGVGVVSVAAHLVGDRIQAMVDKFMAGDVAEAARLNCALLPLFRAMFVTTNPIPVKAAMRLMGHDVGPFRLPLTEPSADELAQIRAALVAFGLLPH